MRTLCLCFLVVSCAARYIFRCVLPVKSAETRPQECVEASAMIAGREEYTSRESLRPWYTTRILRSPSFARPLQIVAVYFRLDPAHQIRVLHPLCVSVFRVFIFVAYFVGAFR